MTARPADTPDYHAEMRAGIEAKLAALPPSGYLNTALSRVRLEAAFAAATRQVEVAGGTASALISFPPLVLFCDRHSISQLAAFEDDLRRVVGHSKKTATELTAFLSAGDREWRGGLFEIAAKGRLLQIAELAVELDAPLPNGREADALVYWRGGRTISIECTVVTESDEDRGAWDRFVASQQAGDCAVMVRPGPHDAPGARSPSSYYDAVRIYSKVYDKLAEGLDPQKSQFQPNTPSVLLVSVWSLTTSLDPGGPGVRWALDELFADQPRKRTMAEGEEGFDIALGACIDFAVAELGLGLPESAHRSARLIAAPRGLGGILLFAECSLTAARMNYNARRECRLTHGQMAELESWLAGAPYWV